MTDDAQRQGGPTADDLGRRSADLDHLTALIAEIDEERPVRHASRTAGAGG
jgi:hypothetical protein